MRTLVIGDIHGGLKALKQVLKRADVTPKDRLVFLGDYVDGWSESAQTVRFLIELEQNNPCIFLRGNHDDLCYHWLLNNEKPLMWMQHGGQSSINSYKNINNTEKELHRMFFEKLKNYYEDANNRLFVHAGFQSLHGPKMEYYDTAFYWDRTLWEMALALNKKLKKDNPKYPQRLKHYTNIYIGHTPVTRIGKSLPYQAANVWNLDTGAAFRGALSIMDVDTEQVWQSDPVHTLYPDENGRN